MRHSIHAKRKKKNRKKRNEKEITDKHLGLIECKVRNARLVINAYAYILRNFEISIYIYGRISFILFLFHPFSSW